VTAASGKEIDRALTEILTSDEFSALAEDNAAAAQMIGEVLDTYLRALHALVGDLRSRHPALFVAALVIGLAAIALSVWLGARGAARRRSVATALESTLPETLRGDPAQLRADAETAARQGRYLDAVRFIFRATIIERALREGSLERLRDAELFRRACTYRELIGEFARNEGQAERMRRVAERIELGLYAGVELGRPDWEEARSLARELS
jgi:hypothetical protein